MNIRRILVALDASTQSLEALEAAAELASRLGAELLGLFVEDVNLLRLAELPFAREIGLASPIARELDSAMMQRALRLAARRAKTAMEAATQRRRVPWSFRVARGSVAAELLAAAQEVDLLAVGKAGDAGRLHPRLGSTTLSLLEKAPRLLLLQQGTVLRPPVLVVVRDDSEAARQALELGALLAGGAEQRLVVVVVVAKDARSALQLERSLEGTLTESGLVVRRRHLPAGDLAAVLRVAREEQAGAIVTTTDGSTESVREIAAAVECPVFLVRQSAH